MSDVLHPLTVIGVGDDGLGAVGAEAREALAAADVVAGGRRHLTMLGDHPAERLLIATDMPKLLDRLEAERNAGRRLVVLASGDPMFYGIGVTLSHSSLGPALRVLPSLSTAQLACARLKLDAARVVILSAHGRRLGPLLGRALAASEMMFLTDDVNTPAAIASALLDRGMEDAHATVCEHLGGPRERLTHTSLSAIAKQTFARLNVLVIRRRGQQVRRNRPYVGLREESYRHVRGQITKAEVRAVTLSRLHPGFGDVIWDIGAGCGSIAIEAASLNLDAEVFAFERDPEQLRLLYANRNEFQAGNVTIVPGEAPESFAGVPHPWAIFIGGSGGRLHDILDAVRPRMPLGGQVVMNFAALDHLNHAITWIRAARWAFAVTQVAISRSTSIADSWRLDALNPVFVLTAYRPANDEGGPRAHERDDWLDIMFGGLPDTNYDEHGDGLRPAELGPPEWHDLLERGRARREQAESEGEIETPATEQAEG